MELVLFTISLYLIGFILMYSYMAYNRLREPEKYFMKNFSKDIALSIGWPIVLVVLWKYI